MLNFGIGYKQTFPLPLALCDLAIRPSISVSHSMNILKDICIIQHEYHSNKTIDICILMLYDTDIDAMIIIVYKAIDTNMSIIAITMIHKLYDKFIAMILILYDTNINTGMSIIAIQSSSNYLGKGGRYTVFRNEGVNIVQPQDHFLRT